MKIGIQLYTVRAHGKDRDELRNTLGRIRECGYTCVETAGFFGLPIAEFAALVKEYDLEVVSTHSGFEGVASNPAGTAEFHRTLGAKNVSVPGMPGSFYPSTVEGFSAFGQALNNAAKKLADEGMTLSYHNHTHEFLPLGELCGERYIFDNAPLLNLQLDVGHATAAKVDPVEWIERYSDRIVTAHYKDTLFDDEGKRRDMPIGEGWVNWEKVTAALLKTGCEAFIVEHEEFPRDIWDILQTSYNNIAGFLGQAK